MKKLEKYTYWSAMAVMTIVALLFAIVSPRPEVMGTSILLISMIVISVYSKANSNDEEPHVPFWQTLRRTQLWWFPIIAFLLVVSAGFLIKEANPGNYVEILIFIAGTGMAGWVFSVISRSSPERRT